MHTNSLLLIQGLNQGPKKSYSAIATGSLNLAEYASSVEQNETDINIPLSVTSGITESGTTLCVSALNTSFNHQFCP